jgi:hypothetical protein
MRTEAARRGADMIRTTMVAAALAAAVLSPAGLAAAATGVPRAQPRPTSGPGMLPATPPAADKPGGSRPGGSKPGGSKPGGSKPGGSKPGGSKPSGTKPHKPKPNTLATGTDLTLTYMAEAGYAAAVKLQCDPPAGAHPKAAEACTTLKKVRGRPGQLTPARTMCTMIYAPITAGITGTWRGKKIDWSRTYGNSCEMNRANGVLFLF